LTGERIPIIIDVKYRTLTGGAMSIDLARRHYEAGDEAGGLVARIEQALKACGPGPIDPAELAPLDQFHAGGLRATQELADFASIERGASVLDTGLGLGGAARFLAHARGCSVTGVDLAQSFVAAARFSPNGPA
jgi:SAM-dependent methyltransferase